MRAFKGLVVPLLVLLLWEVGSRSGVLAHGTFSRPSEVTAAVAAIMVDGSLVVATFQTLQAASAGLLIAILGGIPLGILLGLSPIAERVVTPTLDFLRPVPPVALIPLSLLIFGFGISMEAAVVAFASIWSITIATTAAVRAIENRLHEVARVLEMTTVDYVRKVVLPADPPPLNWSTLKYVF